MVSCLKGISRGSNLNYCITTHTAPLLYVDFAFTLLVMAMPCMKTSQCAITRLLFFKKRYEAYNTLYLRSLSYDSTAYRWTNLICVFFTFFIFRGQLKPAKYCSHTNYAAICLVPRLLLLRISCNVRDVARIIRIHVVGVNEGQKPLAFLASIHTGSYSLPAEAVFRRSG